MSYLRTAVSERIPAVVSSDDLGHEESGRLAVKCMAQPRGADQLLTEGRELPEVTKDLEIS
jgi:hypothetical protein